MEPPTTGVAQGDRCWVGLGHSQVPGLETVWNKRVASMRLQVAGGKVLIIVCACAPNSSSEYPALLELSFSRQAEKGGPLGVIGRGVS